MLNTYQCLLYCPRPDQPNAAKILATSGSFIHTFSALDGNHCSTWPPYQTTEQHTRGITTEGDTGIEDPATGSNESTLERPQKRRKLSSVREDSGSSAEIVVGFHSRDLGGLETKQSLSSSIANIACTSTGQYVVAVTGEDKCISVFELTACGILNQLSER